MRSNIQVRKFRLKEWLGMWSHISAIRAAARTHASDVPDMICRFLAAATDSLEKEWQETFWLEAVETMDRIQQANMLEWKPPMLVRPEIRKSRDLEPFLYVGGEWYYWWHTFASKYHWSEEYIANLAIEDAFALMQEITVELHLSREWDWILSDRSVRMDPKTKTAVPVPYARPEWMKPSAHKPGKVRILRSMLPVGPIQGDPRMLEHLEIIDDNPQSNSPGNV